MNNTHKLQALLLYKQLFQGTPTAGRGEEVVLDTEHATRLQLWRHFYTDYNCIMQVLV